MLVAADMVQATILTWDVDGNSANGMNGGAGNWNLSANAPTNKVWYDGTTYVAWTASNDAVFGGTGGAVTISGAISPSTLTINADGYVFNNNLLVTAAGDSIAINGNVQFNGSLGPSSNVNTVIASDKTLTLAGGSSTLRTTTGGSVSITGGTPSIGVMAINTSVSQSGGAASNNAAGQAPAIGKGATGSWKLNNASASFSVGTGGVSNLYVGRDASGNGTLSIDAGAVTVSGESNLRIGYATTNSAAATGVVNVSGGTLTVQGATGAVYVGSGGNGSGTLNISGTGTANIDSIRFGRNGDSIGAALTGTLAVSGGTLNVGANGIALDGLSAAKAFINLSGGVVGASADWSSSMGMNLLNTGAGVATFRADDGAATPTAHSITLSGKLTGAGALTKAGAGKLTLSGNNDYVGLTKVNAGTLLVNGSLAASSAVTVSSGAAVGGTGTINGALSVAGGGSIDLRDAGVGTLALKGTSVTLGDSSSANLMFDLGTALGSNDVISINGGLTLGSGGTKISTNALGTALTPGDYTLMTAADGLGTNSLSLAVSSLTLNSVTYQLSLDKSTSTAEVLTVAIPEPATLGTTLGMCGMTLLSRRRRNIR
jgi:autotransporter-associated beta strand protein